MYRPAAFFIDIDRPFGKYDEDPLFIDLNDEILYQQVKIGGGLWKFSGKGLKPHPTNKYCVYSPWYMVDVGAESESDWEENDYGTGIFPILEKHGYQFTGSASLFNVGDKDKMTTLMISFDHKDSKMDWTSKKSPDTSVAEKQYNEYMNKFKAVEAQWNKMYPDPNDMDDMDSDSENWNSDSDNDYDDYGGWNRGSFSSAPIDKRAKARQILGINKSNPSEAEIRRAYRKKARENHPDKGGKPGAMKEINNARDILLPSKFTSKLKF